MWDSKPNYTHSCWLHVSLSELDLVIHLSKIGERPTILISFNVLGGPKNTCQIQRTWEETTSKTIVGFPDPRVYCPF